jgi:hypothetical protein
MCTVSGTATNCSFSCNINGQTFSGMGGVEVASCM